MIDITQALVNLRPNAKWSLTGDDYSGLQWHEPPVWNGGQSKPTREEVEAEATRLHDEFVSKEYQRLRSREYPDFKEYLDGIVKGDNAQVQAYIDKCNEIKAKYPKPAELDSL